MRIDGPATEADMVAAFLRAEVSSPRFSGYMGRSLYDEHIIKKPNMGDAAENRRRLELLAYRRNLFRGFPNDVQWLRATLTRDEFRLLKILNEDSWTGWAPSSRRAEEAAGAIAQGRAPESLTPHVHGIKARLRAGEVLPPVILVGRTGDTDLVILEGHARVMAAILSDLPLELPALIGTSPSMSRWYAF